MPMLMRRPVVAMLITSVAFVLNACESDAILPPIQAKLPEEAITFKANDGQTTDAFRGQLMVPENRANPDSRMIKLEYVRFPATGKTSGSPIIYLAGGPGGSGIGTAKWRRFPLFMAMREFGDVIAFDQRGTGASNDLPTCTSQVIIPETIATTDKQYAEQYRRAGAECVNFWREEGIDLYGYTTTESVADLESLRLHLGAEKISLWGISYGSHLSLAAIKTMDDRIDRVVIASVEGLDQTVKYPARTDAYFQRLQEAINTRDDLRAGFPDIKGLIRRVHTKLEETPMMVSFAQSDGTTANYLLQRRDLQNIMSGMIADPRSAIMGLSIYAELDQGGSTGIAGLLARWHTPNEPITFSPMTFAMDIASGTGAARKTRLAAQAKTSLLADYLNFPMPQLEGVVPGLDLGDAFRVAPKSSIPVLVLSGTLDGRTYVESQSEAVAGLKNAEIVIVENAGHNLFMATPEVATRIAQFMRGEPSSVDRIKVNLPE